MVISNEPRLTKNAAKCKLCGDVIESTYRHDMKWCTCGNVAVDGGLDYVKRSFITGPDDYENIIEYDSYPEVPGSITDVSVDQIVEGFLTINGSKFSTPKLLPSPGVPPLTDSDVVATLSTWSEHDVNTAIKFGRVAFVGQLIGLPKGQLARRVRRLRRELAEVVSEGS